MELARIVDMKKVCSRRDRLMKRVLRDQLFAEAVDVPGERTSHSLSENAARKEQEGRLFLDEYIFLSNGMIG